MLRIVTLNTWKCEGEYEKRLAIMFLQLKELVPDIIALQECFATTDSSYHTAKWLAERLNMDYFYCPLRRKERRFNNQRVDSFSGLSILSKIPIIQQYKIDLPSSPEDTDRAAIVAGIHYNDTPVTIANLHLTHLQNHNNLRNIQFKALLDSPIMKDKQGITIYCGDFNCETSSDEMLEFFKPPFNLKDTYTMSEKRGEPSYTCPISDHVPEKNKRKIDHILLAPFQHSFPTIRNASIVLHSRGINSQLYASDHFGVSVDIEF